MVRIMNGRDNQLLDLEARMMLVVVEKTPAGTLKRNYISLKMERSQVAMFPLPWTLVHPIDSESPVYEKNQQDLERMEAELLVLVKGFDDTFSQNVHARTSYLYSEFEWDVRFSPAFRITENGVTEVNPDKLSATEKV
jgi:inward rectifier potassium channel